MASHQEELNKSLESVGYRAPQHEVLVVANSVMSLENYLAIVAAEVQELAEEHDRWYQSNDNEHSKTQFPKSWFMELFDVIVTLRNARERIAPSFSVEKTIFSVNGQFKDNFNSLKEQVLNLGEGNVERNLQLIFTELLSMLKHLDIDLQSEIYIELVNTKLEANKESRFYQKEPGMSELDMLVKYDHVTAALRILRKFLLKATGQEMVMQPWITDFFEEEILGWRGGAATLQKLEQKISMFKLKIKDELFWSLTGSSANENDPFLEMKMMIAGAKIV